MNLNLNLKTNLNKNLNNTVSRPVETVKWICIWLLSVIIIIVNLKFTAQASWLIAIENIAGLGLIFSMLMLTQKGRRFRVFVKEAKIELHKIVWSTPKETLQSAAVVIIVVLIASIFLWGIDNFLLWLLNYFTGQRG